MSRQINQPINQVRLTNVAVVRYNVKGKRFEIACYRNKVLDYRQGLETDLSEVLQTDRIFTNVSKGQFANSSQLEQCFGTRDQEAIAKLILQKGNSLQVSDLERNQQYEQRLQQIATWVAHNCVDGATQRQFSVAAIRQALELHQFNGVQPHKAIKKQYLDAVKFLQQFLPSLQRAKMELLLEYPTTAESQVEALLAREPASRQVVMQRSEPSDGATRTITIQVDPSLYRDWNELAKQHASRLEIVQQAVVRQGDVNLQIELAQRQKQQQQAAAEPENKDVSKESTAEPELVSESVAVPKEEVSEEEEDGVRHDDEKKDRDVDDEDEPVVKLSKKEQRRRAKKNKKAQRREEKEQAEAQLRAERQEEEDEHETASTTEKPAASALEAPGNEAKVLHPKTHKSCNTCGGSFAINSAEYRAHFRSDWHRFNQKLQLQGKPPVSEQEFQLCDVDTFFSSEYDDN